MIKPPKPWDEEERLAALLRYEILDTPSEEAFDDLVKIASGLCGLPTATVSLIDSDRQWFKARHNLELVETSRDVSFCGHAILDPDNVMVVADATADERFHDNPLVTAEGGIRFYAGAPLKSSDGHAIGTLCVFGGEAMQLDPPRLDALKALSRQVSHLLELRRVSRELKLQLRDRAWYEQQLQDYQEALESQNADLAEQTRTDVLTGLPNRRAFAVALAAEMEKARSSGQHLCVAVLDIDHFKTINDLHGHAVGDKVLVELASMLKAQFAGGGMAARYGGEEFVLLLPDADEDKARLQCEFLRQSVSLLPIGLPVTVSIGVAAIRRRDDTPEDAFRRADEALYAAKHAGRDRVEVAP
ncbi:MAG: sensor domain-containing diguanylate cyclase [Lysobacteraceae bacterium]|nr:MAG: sensor domain-containing diguanylate cyclase [Xanthomonadaceae bacterium]